MIEKIKANKKIWIPITIGILLIVAVLIGVLANQNSEKTNQGGKPDNKVESNQGQDDKNPSADSDDANGGGIEIVDKDTDEKEDSVKAPASWGGSDDDKNQTENSGTTDTTQDNNQPEDNSNEKEDADDDNVSKENVLKDDKEWSKPF